MAELCLPFIGPEKFDKQKPETPFISYGGYAINQNGASGRVEIYAVYGMNEGVQSLVADRYLVEAREYKYLLISKEIPQKDKMICPTEEIQAEIVPVAGMFETYLNIKGGGLPEKVLAVMRSTFFDNVYDYLLGQKDLANNLKMAVVVQEMVPARAAGVIFGADIRGHNTDINEGGV